MKKRIFLPLFFMLFFFSLCAQDTIIVQTLTFDSITTRRGTWEFPQGEEYRKILMYYTLKCDPQTTHDPYPCGEWDYLTYTNVFDHTGVWDSTLYFHPSFTYINGLTDDSVLMRNEATYSFYRKLHKSVVYDDTLSIENITIGQGSGATGDILATSKTDGRSVFLWTANELSDQGLSAGNINGIKLNITSANTDIRHLTLKMDSTDLEEITHTTYINNLHPVYFNELQVTGPGWYDFNFTEPFEWNGFSNLLIEFSFENPEAGDDIILAGDETGWNCGISASGTNYAINLDGEMDFIDLPDDPYFNSNFTFEAWLNKKNNNKWSRVFDFGNGPNQSNVIITFCKNTSGNLSIHINNQSGSQSFETTEPLPLNEWTHIAVSLENHIGYLYINGDFSKYGMLQQPDNVTRTINYIGRSNWANDTFANGFVDEFRIYNYARTDEEIKADYLMEIDNPQANPGLILYYQFNEGAGVQVTDHSLSGDHGTCYGLPTWYKIPGPETYLGFQQNNMRPQIVFERLTYSTMQELTDIVSDSLQNSQVQIILFEDLEDPTTPTDTITTWRAGYSFVYQEGEVIDTVYYDYTEILYKEELPYYGEPFEILDRYEIGRFITPYGIGLSLGANGFRWVYDVTDYAHLLQGMVDMNAGNQQELIDVKFLMITGTLPRDVLDVNRIWGQRASHSYKNLDSNFVLSNITLPLLPEAEQFKVKTRITGHGHHSNTGNYPHCCEWRDNTHYFLVNDEEIASWHIFQHNECALNPVFPQGGTWPGAREGWCPGAPVKDHEFEITEYVTGDEVTLDYDITPVPPNNLGMGNGNYVMAMHLVQYATSNFDVDIEVYDVITPSDWEYYLRINPICYEPTVVIRNNGNQPLVGLNFTYGVSGGPVLQYTWAGNLAPHHFEEVELPVPDESFWLGDGSDNFSVSISIPFGQQDEYPDNDYYQTHFNLPDLYDEPMVLVLKTNNQGWRYSLKITDINENIIVYREGLDNNTIYTDTLDYADGCYTIKLTDSDNMGLYYWAYPGQGSGYLRLQAMDETIIKNFEPEFGRTIFYPFNFGEVTYISNPNLDQIINVYPNPVTKILTIDFQDLEGKVVYQIYNSLGELLITEQEQISGHHLKKINMDSFPSGLYFLQVNHKQLNIQKKILKQ